MISTIVPVYNAEKYIHRCVGSILSQTFSDFELILVDDGSLDGSGRICDEYANKDSRVKVIHQQNQGQAAARNTAVKAAAGEWICFVDSDDLIHPQMLEVLYHAVCNSKAKISMCGNTNGTEPQENFYRQSVSEFFIHSVDETYLAQLYDCGGSRPWIVCGKLVHKGIIEKYPFTPGRIFEDNAVVCRWLYEASIVADIDTELYFYRMTPVSTMRGAFNLKKRDYLWALEEIVNFYEEVGYSGLCRRWSAEYIICAVAYYKIVCKDLEDRKKAWSIQVGLCRFLRKHRRYIVLTRRQKKYIWHLLFPVKN